MEEGAWTAAAEPHPTLTAPCVIRPPWLVLGRGLLHQGKGDIRMGVRDTRFGLEDLVG